MTGPPITRVASTLFPDPGTGRQWFREELSHPQYRESLVDRFSRWFDQLLDGLRNVGGGGFGTVLALVLLLVLVVGAALLLSRLRGNPAPATGPAPLFAEARQSAAEHRRLAETALAVGHWDEAVVEAVRALASGLFERGLVVEHPNVTVQEIVAAASRSFPRHAERLTGTGRAFDATRYGGRKAAAPEARDAVALEHELSTQHPEEPGTRGPFVAVPR